MLFSPNEPSEAWAAPSSGAPAGHAAAAQPASSGASSAFYPPAFVAVLGQRITASAQNNAPGTLMLVAITNLAMIINAYGHDTSETVMEKLTRMIERVLGPGDTIERVERDQIGIILSNSHPEDAESIAQRIHTIIQNFGRDNFATASLHIIGIIGSINFPSQTISAADALDKVYIAIHSTHGAPHRTFDITRHEADQCRQQMGLANYLFNAFKERRLRLAYQPVIETRTGLVAHYEALLRLINQTGKVSSAGALIPVAERMNLIDLIDGMVLEMVVRELRATPELSMALNVSNLTTENSLWLESIGRFIKETPEIAPRLTVEITETAAHRDLRRAAYFVASLQSMGCLVALDDFGSGYTSFRQLKALSVDMVKIDGVFIKDLSKNADNRFFVKILLDFAQGFGLKTVAEFVENGETAKILMEMGVDYMQGYYFGKPENRRLWLNEGEFKRDS